ncbi:hypothetical protein [Primorskyibacter sp. S87]|uniref:hypothetical protein n=1 Tax=Primorskyibacter sp. S87 TaxID=3415126 RepID=UPI003C79931F
MRYLNRAVSRSQQGYASQARKTAAFLLWVVAGSFGLDPVSDASAQSSYPPYVVGNDRGGYIKDRLYELRNLRASGQPVEIRGKVCYSTCTMLLGLPNTCISPNTEFGFHGPKLNGKPLPPDRFEYFSQVIAQYYPQPLRDWYMKTGRNRLHRAYKIKGKRIIAMGIRACDT